MSLLLDEGIAALITAAIFAPVVYLRWRRRRA